MRGLLQAFFGLFRRRPKVSNLRKHAERELRLAGYNLNDKELGPNKWMVEDLLELIDVFSKQGHSGFSAGYCIQSFTTLASFKCLTPLTGEDSEWTLLDSLPGNEVAEQPSFPRF